MFPTSCTCWTSSGGSTVSTQFCPCVQRYPPTLQKRSTSKIQHVNIYSLIYNAYALGCASKHVRLDGSQRTGHRGVRRQATEVKHSEQGSRKCAGSQEGGTLGTDLCRGVRRGAPLEHRRFRRHVSPIPRVTQQGQRAAAMQSQTAPTPQTSITMLYNYLKDT